VAAPAAQSAAQSAARPQEPPVAPGTLVLRRTSTGARGTPGAATRRHETIRIREEALVRRAGVVRTAAPGSGPAAAAAAAALPPVLELPARAASAVCENAAAWRREARVGAYTVVTRGRGDEPWSSIETWADGRLVARGRTVWERGRGSWRLASHEDASADGATRTVVVDRAHLRRDQGAGAIPRVHCADARTGVVPAAPAEPSPLVAGATGLGALGPIGPARLELAARFAAEDCTGSDQEAEAACTTQMVAVVSAGAAVVGAAAGVWLGCVVPTPVVVATCIQAMTGLTTASAALALATSAYEDCRAGVKAPQACSSCPANPMDVRAVGTTSPAAAPLALDCAEPSAPSGGGGGGGGQPTGSGNGYWAEICEYLEHYDEDGNYLYTSDLTCRVVWIS
jgi:hypothetical protein